MANIKLGHLLAKVPTAEVKITNISFELHDLLGWAIVECELLVGSGSKATESAISLTIPVQVTVSEINEWFDVVKSDSIIRRRRK